jgi:hypothetical protein
MGGGVGICLAMSLKHGGLLFSSGQRKECGGVMLGTESDVVEHGEDLDPFIGWETVSRGAGKVNGGGRW